MKLFWNISALVALIVSVISTFTHDWSNATLMMAYACFAKISAIGEDVEQKL